LLFISYFTSNVLKSNSALEIIVNSISQKYFIHWVKIDKILLASY